MNSCCACLLQRLWHVWVRFDVIQFRNLFVNSLFFFFFFQKRTQDAFTARARFYKAIRISDTHKLCTTISHPYSRRRGNKFTACFPSKQTGQTEYDVGQWAINSYDRVSLDLLPHPEWTFGAYVYIHTRHINSTKRTSSKKDAPSGIYTLHFIHTRQHRCVQAYDRTKFYLRPDKHLCRRVCLKERVYMP